MPFEFEKTSIPDVILIKPRVFKDDRGFFVETYKKEDFDKIGLTNTWVQDNHSKSTYGVLRGLHFQQGQYSQAKLVRCVKGEVYDVAVDLRRNSPTFGKYVGVILSEENKHELYIPRGFAHGFAVVSKEAEIEYKNDNVYSPQHEGGIMWNDPTVNIEWPIKEPILSEKDKKWYGFDEAARKMDIKV